MLNIIIGFVGSSEGITSAQRQHIEALLDHPQLRITAAHHADCLGADVQFHKMCRDRSIPVTLHPPKNKNLHAHSKGAAETRTPLNVLDRSQNISDRADLLLLVPRGEIADVGSSHIRQVMGYARLQKIANIVLHEEGAWKFHKHKCDDQVHRLARCALRGKPSLTGITKVRALKKQTPLPDLAKHPHPPMIFLSKYSRKARYNVEVSQGVVSQKKRDNSFLIDFTDLGSAKERVAHWTLDPTIEHPVIKKGDYIHAWYVYEWDRSQRTWVLLDSYIMYFPKHAAPKAGAAGLRIYTPDGEK